MYMVVVIFNNGFLVKVDEMQVIIFLLLCIYMLFVFLYFIIDIYKMVIFLQVLVYLMMVVLDNYRLLFLVIGNKYKNGLDIVLKDLD